MKPGTAMRWTCASKRPGQRYLPLQSMIFCVDDFWVTFEGELGMTDSMMPLFIVTEQFLRIVPFSTSTTLALVRT